MPYLKQETITVSTAAGHKSMQLRISVNSKGQFYTSLPEDMQDVAFSIFGDGNSTLVKNSKFNVYAGSLQELVNRCYECLSVIYEPKITEEYVIHYNIESHVAFAENENGDIFPNATFPGADWPANRDSEKRAEERYGGHHAAMPAKGGYSLTIGAKALTKTTYTYRKDIPPTVKYTPYHKDGHHLSHDNPASLLNSWCSFRIDKQFKEIPYSDKAALFFHDLMLSMAKISQLIQDNTFDDNNLMYLIENNVKLLGHK